MIAEGRRQTSALATEQNGIMQGGNGRGCPCPKDHEVKGPSVTGCVGLSLIFIPLLLHHPLPPPPPPPTPHPVAQPRGCFVTFYARIPIAL